MFDSCGCLMTFFLAPMRKKHTIINKGICSIVRMIRRWLLFVDIGHIGAVDGDTEDLQTVNHGCLCAMIVLNVQGN